MKLKKKVLTSTLAASLAVGTLAGVPVYATTALPSQADDFIKTLDAVYAKLGTTDKETLKAARNAIAGLTDTTLVSPISGKIKTKIGTNTAAYPKLSDRQELLTLIKEFIAAYSGLTYAESKEALDKIYVNEDYRAIVNELYKLGEQESLEASTDDVAQLFALANEIQTKVIAQVKIWLDTADYTKLLDYKAQLKAIVKDALDKSNSKAAKAFKNIGITAEDILETRANFSAALAAKEVNLKDVEQALGVAYLSTLDLKENNNNNNNNGNIGADPSPVGPNKTAATESIGKVAAGLDELLKDKGNGLAKAVAAIQEALRQAATIDVSKSVSVSGDKATASLDASKLADIFKTVKDIAAIANAKLKEAATGAPAVKVVATLDLGSVSASEIAIPLSKDLLAKAKENGIDALALKVNGVVLAIDIDQLGTGADLNIKKQAKSLVPTSAGAVASDVYEFNFKVDGKEKATFAKPVEVRLPVASVTGLDQELLVFTKIDDGKLVYKGGQYDAASKSFIVANKSFSTYTILENKASFKDITSVKDWAGRQIGVVAAKGIIDGRAEGQFVPDASLTRAEFAKLIVKTFGLENDAAKESFTDVEDGAWYQPYVAAAAEAGLIEGRDTGIFAPEATITRAELATIAARALNKLKSYQAVAPSDEALAVFKDADDVHATLKDGVALAAEQGIVVGQDEGKFNPNEQTTRAEAAVVIYRLLNK